MPGPGQPGPEPPQILPRQLMGLRGGDRHHVEAAGIQRIRHPADVPSLAGRVPALVADDDRNLLPVDDVMQLGQPALQLLQFLFVFLVPDGGRQIHLGQLRHRLQREFLLEGVPVVLSLLQGLLHGLVQQLQRRGHRRLPLVSVQHMPGRRLPGLLHELLVAGLEPLVFPLLPQVLLGDAPFRIRIFHQLRQPGLLLLPVDIQKQLQHNISRVPQLPLEFVHLPHPAPVLVPGDFVARNLPDAGFHPAGVQKNHLSVFRDGRRVGIQEGIAHLAFRNHRRGDHIVKPGIQLADQLLDQASLAGRRPALHQNQNRHFGIPDFLYLLDEPVSQLPHFLRHFISLRPVFRLYMELTSYSFSFCRCIFPSFQPDVFSGSRRSNSDSAPACWEK